MTQHRTSEGESDVADLQRDLYAIEAGQAYLLANKCTACNRVHFPKHRYCAKCGSPDLVELRLSRVGRIGAFSFIDRQPADAFIEAPYLQAEVEMPEGVSVFSVIEAPAQGELAIGMPAEVIVRVFETQDGPRRAFLFRPILKGGTHAA